MANTKYTRGKDGYFTTAVWDGTYTATGKKHRKTLRTKKSSRELERMVAGLKADVEARKSIKKSDTTFLEYAKTWRTIYKSDRENNTKAMYDRIINVHFSAIGNIKLQDIDRIHIQTVLNNAKGKERTQEQIYMTFKEIINSAVTDHLFPANVRDDIFANSRRIKHKAAEKRRLTENEKRAIMSAEYKQEKDRAYTYIIYGCGLRRGEAAALTVFDFDFSKKRITVNKAFEYTQNTPSVKKTKNGKEREVPIPALILPVIKSFVDLAKKENRTYIFTTEAYNPLTKSAYRKMWERILKALENASEDEITGLSGHIFRHNYCTSLCYQIPKISIKKIAYLMGDTEAVVMNVYNHIVLEKEAAEDAVNEAMNL